MLASYGKGTAAPVFIMSSLGQAPRPYDNPSDHSFIMPKHRHDDKIGYMRANADDKLEVVAECFRHTAMQLRTDLKNGLEAPCPHGERCRSNRRYDVERPNVQRKKKV